ncbi:MAG: hypothetical protein Q8N13_04140 [Acidovorax sp.]|nr:hypothetical protein [Acidovorax sp.]
MLVTHVIGDCPGCGAENSYGNVSVRDHVLRGCMHCEYQSLIWLPDIRKKVIYLDQFFLSHSFRGGDPRFLVAVERVKRISRFQLLVAPYSSVHEDETHQWRGYKDKSHDQLMEFIKATARGAEFNKDYNVERKQVLKAWGAFLKGQSTAYVFEVRDAISGTLDEWDDYYRIDVGGYNRDIELKRTLKTQAVNELINVFDQWQASTQTFDQDVALEVREAGKNYMNTYLTMVKRISQGDFKAVIDSPLVAKVVEHMMHWLPDEQSPADRLRRCAEFFASDYFAQVPKLWVEARMFATLKDMVKRGAYANRDAARKRLSGVFDDIKHISLYAPYCDAFVMDTPMADLVQQPTVGLEQRYGVKIFSLNNWHELLAWLDALEENMSAEHRAGLAAAYPE